MPALVSTVLGAPASGFRRIEARVGHLRGGSASAKRMLLHHRGAPAVARAVGCSGGAGIRLGVPARSEHGLRDLAPRSGSGVSSDEGAA